MEAKGISRQLRTRLNEIYKETRSVVKVGGKTSKKFWTTKGVRQGCPLSPTLFTLYIAELEEKMERGQAGGVVIGREKIWTLAYADDITLLAKKPEDLKEMIKRMKRLLDKKQLTLNAEKSKVLIFNKGKNKKKKEEWIWGEEKIEEVKDFKYLRFHFQKNGSTETHMRETVKKAMIAMTQVWGIRKFKNNFERRIMLFSSLVGSIVLYAAEIWGWTEEEKLEKMHEKYI